MQPVLVRMELGTLDGPMPNFTVIVDEFVRKAQAVGVPVRPAMKVTDTLEHPEAWDAEAGTEGYIAFLGTQTERGDAAVAALSKISVEAPAVIRAKVLSPTEVDEFQSQARRINELRKARQEAAGKASVSAGRHAAAPIAAVASRTPAVAVAGEPYELALGTPDDAAKTPLDILGAVR